MSAAESIAKFRAEVGAAVTRASRAADDAGHRNGALRQRTRELVERAQARQVKASSPTSPELLDSAVGFRTDRGLPVERFPEVVSPPAVPESVEVPTTLGSIAVAGPSGQLPHVGDDDEDFSQSRILY